jgi:hypothetical protein
MECEQLLSLFGIVVSFRSTIHSREPYIGRGKKVDVEENSLRLCGEIINV